MAKLRKLSPELCDTCIFMPVVTENGCSYMTLTGKSRVFEDGKRVVPKGYCDKYKQGEKCTSYHSWRATDMTMIYWDKGGQVYEKYNKGNGNDDGCDTDS